MITSYSLVNGIGIQMSENTLGYIAVLFVVEIFVAGFFLTIRWQRLMTLPRRCVYAGLAGGVISGVAYRLGLFAKKTGLLGVASALR